MTSVAVFWDIENCAPPSKMKGTLVERKLREAIREMGPIRQIFAYAEQSGFPEDLRMELQRSGIHLIDAPHGRHGKDVADQMIITDMFVFAMENPAPQTIVIVSGDIDFAYPLAKLRQREYKIVLVIPPVGANRVLKMQADIVLEWAEIMGTKAEPEFEWIEPPSLKYDPLIAVLRELEQEGNEQPDIPTIGERLDAKFPTWADTTGFKSYVSYIEDARLNGWVSAQTIDGSARITEIKREESLDIVDQERFSPLLAILRETARKGIHEPELAKIGIELRAMMEDPLEALGVERLKDYVLEAQEAGLVRVRQDGLQHYISLVDWEATKESSAEQEQTLDLLEKSLNSLEEDQIMPSERAVMGRMRELQPKWNVFRSCFKSMGALLTVAQERRGIAVQGLQSHKIVFPKSGEFQYVNPNDTSQDSFSVDEWQALEQFLQGHPDMVTQGRYGFAKRIVEEKLKGLSGRSLGELILMTQLAVNKGWLVFHWNRLSVASGSS